MNNTREEMATSAKTKKKDIRLAKSDLLMMLGFILALAVLCFTLGVRLGKKQALTDYEKLSLSQKMAESKRVDILEQINNEAAVVEPKKEKMPTIIKEQIVEKENPFKAVIVEPKVVKVTEEVKVEEQKKLEPAPVKESIAEEVKVIKPTINTDPIPFLESGNPALSNSYTIMIGEFLDYEEASLFAQAFKERGYQPFLQKYSSKGIDKVRVSLGSYVSKEKAEKFIVDRSEVFIAGKYKINKFL